MSKASSEPSRPIAWDVIRAAARDTLKREIAAAISEAAHTPPFKPGPMEWGA
jgi:hypothetical protein